MNYLSQDQLLLFRDLLQTFFTLPYSTDLDGKDAESLIRIVKGITGEISKRKELFDIIDGNTGYSVKTLKKNPNAVRVDLQEQRLGDVTLIRSLRNSIEENAAEQGELLLKYMYGRIQSQMLGRNITVARSLILLKYWDPKKENFQFKYWEEDFLGYIENLIKKNEEGSIEWISQPAGLHGRDKNRKDSKGKNIRLLRMHYKHNQIFTDHDIPDNSEAFGFNVNRIGWKNLVEVLKENGFII